MITKKTLLTALLLTLTFSVSAQSGFGNSEKVKGNGNVVTENRTTENYRGIMVGGSFDVVLIKGREGKITMEGEENIIPFIETEINDGILKINYKKNTNIRTTKKLIVTVTFETIESVALGGSGNISCKETIKANHFNVSLGGSGNIDLKIDSDTVNSNIGGSGNIELHGSTNKLKGSIAGSGSLKAYDLTTKEITAIIAGSGNISTTVKDKINAKIVGSGSVYYKGNPKHIDSKSVGSGSVVEKN
ncbi:head GIN domain-containing protein [Polaribacter sp. IC073]|uniref:head GIN domain-containing protein n=1 Tax=Polaribacter sp. IC073 TaxID=2508540 RepID=UPI0011BEDB97|nr:head GIN domain-containing protein [Polaribacter sp. IC073]TXD47287.1 DUF2807 domain-containing protein [Polaribacter sp. IC073]